DGAVVYLNGQEVFRYNMPGGTITSATPASSNFGGAPGELGPTSIGLANLRSGVNVIAVEAHNSATTSADLFMGLKLDALIVTNVAAPGAVVINEILADNSGLGEADGSTPDWVEIYNTSNGAVDLSDMSLTDSVDNPRRWVFPSGAIISAQGYFRVRFDADLPASGTNTGFGLNANGDSLYLINKAGAGVLDSRTFGLQLRDFSIARLPSGSANWNLALPTIGAANIAAALGNPSTLKVNEWMANPMPGKDDYFEIYNPTPQAIALGGLWLTDDLSVRNKHQITPLSFIGPVTNAWREFKADGNTTAGADHVGFSLSGGGEAVGISLADLTLIDG